MGDVATSVSVMADRWLLLIHQLPAKPAYLRVKVWRRLQALGAVAVKNAVYALPANEQTQEDFEWVLKEITEGGGEALICEAQLIDGVRRLDRVRGKLRRTDPDMAVAEWKGCDPKVWAVIEGRMKNGYKGLGGEVKPWTA